MPRRKFFDAAESMSPKEREKYFRDKLLWIVRHAYENSPAMRDKLDKAGVGPASIRSVADLVRIPITRKEELIERQKANPPYGGYVSKAARRIARAVVAPGPLYMAYSPTGRHTMAKVFFTMGVGAGDLVDNTLAYNLMPGLVADDALRLLGAVVVPLGVGNTELHVQAMRDLKITGFIGTPSFLMNIIKRAEERGYDFRRDFIMRKALSLAEPLYPSLRRSFEQDYGISVTDMYGSTELGLLGYECSQHSGFHMPEELLIEIIDPATGKQLGPGEPGEVVVTAFNEVVPLLRYGTGDLSVFTDEPCPCGRTSSRFIRIMGRVGDAVKVRGVFLVPKQVEESLNKSPQICRCQIVVSRIGHRDNMCLKIETREECKDRESLFASLNSNFQEVCRLKLDSVEIVPAGTIPSGGKTIVDERTWE